MKLLLFLFSFISKTYFNFFFLNISKTSFLFNNIIILFMENNKEDKKYEFPIHTATCKP